ncbi:hypothetical protein BCR42DRAFT_352890 [Absidia repens]|uniref:Uncharacterized protein n=1 Tax=Absidia repens TaxID=90262 RepID=A0A1X2IG58_9FUNG|nr:hypothetical protein BCR42DRAFT_352890 [Absidia repens]
MATPPPQEEKAQVSEQAAFPPIRHKSTTLPPAPTEPRQPPKNSTNKTILDYLLYRSTQSRLKQAQVESLEMTTYLQQNQDKDTIQEQKQRWMEMMNVAEQDKNAVESVVKGILSNHRSKRPSFEIDNHFEQRLHLCQLTNLIFGRRETSETDTTTDTSSTTSNKRRRRHHLHHHQHHHHHHQHHLHLHQHHRRPETSTEQATIGQDDNETKICRWTSMITPNHCRRHRLQLCDLCTDKSTTLLSTKVASSSSSPFSPGLLEAIPTFLKTSADLLRHTLETNHHQHHDQDNIGDDDDDDDNKKKPMIFAGQKVMGGGMPPRWYDLFLELLTQAAIECYLCDMETGLEAIYEIFSYGDVEDEDEPERHTDDEEDEDEEDEEDEDEEDVEDSHTPKLASADNNNDDDNDGDDDDWSVEAADHHLLFPKTRTMYLFKTQVREREKEILVIEENTSLHQHFQALAKRYPLDNFEKNMGEYIQMIHHTMAVPDLDTTKDEGNSTTMLEKEATPSIYKYPCDGSLLMPELTEEDEETNNNKRRASVDLEKDDDSKRHG